ncbi:LamB/YcsF family protein [Paenibacillus doosanensis]|uniref:5-oxoprolinase subunit A n=1 Tax=Paenibacillus konkukensis TaxID=2020716 RepID=A0ABY4RX35_9BACL|nr:MULTISPECIES: 5-oxoprolinase subunit PxpA [Paenibacillus]MCS7460341.1 LamB/YcsF family protein [Paenibacillus doosanensis]UQZ86113.1 LamB/YcsF family protein [Paenibacillus konkukensis]
MRYVDLNCDMGESFGAYRLGRDEEILSYVTSANIACGFHAGDAGTMRKTVKLALENGVAIGAHPGLQDLIGFGRRKMDISPQEAYDIAVYQIGALWGFVRSEGGTMQHVKAHGELYNMAAVNPGLAEAIAEAVYKVDPELILFGLANSELLKAGKKAGLRTASEVFSDRTYQDNGTLTPRRQPDAMITDDREAVKQVIRMVNEGKVLSRQNTDVLIQADTVCIHGDGAHALEFARMINESLRQAGITVQSIGKTISDNS